VLHWNPEQLYKIATCFNVCEREINGQFLNSNTRVEVKLTDRIQPAYLLLAEVVLSSLRQIFVFLPLTVNPLRQRYILLPLPGNVGVPKPLFIFQQGKVSFVPRSRPPTFAPIDPNVL
jgi:hypothetical protein